MRALILNIFPVLFFSIAVTADVVPALQRSAPQSYEDARQSINPLLSKRLICDSAHPYTCSAVDGDTMCMAESEVCCQRIASDGTYPFVCDASHPYCCPPKNGVPQCGSDSSCGGRRSNDGTSKFGAIDGGVLVAAILGGLVAL